MRRPNDSAFSMIEVAVAIAVIAILAGSVAPLALKALNQQREQKTRDNLKVAYETLFGARDRRVSNMATDFGFNQNPPAANPVDLRFMTNPAATNGSGVIPQPYQQGGAGAVFFWGWNGPYWTGSTSLVAGLANGIPADGWGRPILLYNGPRVVSAGTDGNYNTPDDLAYPTLLGTPTTTLTVNVNRIHAAPAPALTVTVTIIDLNRNLPRPRTKDIVYGADLSGTKNAQIAVNPGPVEIQIPTTPVSAAILDLLPGESKTIEFQIYD